MSLLFSDSAESTYTVLTCTSQEFQSFYDNESLLTDDLSDDALRNIIGPNSARLREAETRYRLDDLLSAMLEHAPHPLGRRYVAVTLHVARQKGEDGVVNAAKAWLDGLLLPMLAVSKAIKTWPVSSQTPTAKQHIESASRNDQRVLRAKVALREQYRCAITKTFDKARVEKLQREGRVDEIPRVGQLRMEPAHIMPFLLNKVDNRAIDGRRSPHFWDMLRSWTQIDFETLVVPNINSPMNAIYMTRDEHDLFGHFTSYLDKEAYPGVPNKYKVRVARSYTSLSNGLHEVDVESPTRGESSVEPPNPDYLNVHAAFAKVLHLCGVAQYMESVDFEAEMEGTLRLNGETDFGSYLQSKLASW
ncbi:hypothetical protein EDB89DRAFT_2074117 [Lactarius sanguifluus]|nr:hypothetical protein EDB89DRAFT_2074117 [Lactarius sanguifluus]